MKPVSKAALFVAPLLLSASALAQSAGTASPTNPCDQLVQAVTTAGASATMTRQQAETLRTNGDANACRTALAKVEPASSSQAAAGSTTPQTGTQPGATAQAGAGPSIQIQQPAP